MAKKATTKKVVKKTSPKKVKKTKKVTTSAAKVEEAVDSFEKMHLSAHGRDPHTLSVVDAVLNSLQNVRTEFVFAEVFHRLSCPTLHMEWMFDKYWYDYVMRFGVPALEAIYTKLKQIKVFNPGDFDYNDLDNGMWIIDDPKGDNRRILIHTSQNTRFLFIWDQGLLEKPEAFGTIHVRRFFDRYKVDQQDEFDVRDEKKFIAQVAEHGTEWAIRKLDRLSEYADDVLDNMYPERYSLQHYIDNGFQMQYGDGRDKGYVISATGFFPKADWTVSHHSLLKIVWDIYVSCMLTELYSCNNAEFLSGYFDEKGVLLLSETNKDEDEE